jgi:hypothetical protein
MTWQVVVNASCCLWAPMFPDLLDWMPRKMRTKHTTTLLTTGTFQFCVGMVTLRLSNCISCRYLLLYYMTYGNELCTLPDNKYKTIHVHAVHFCLSAVWRNMATLTKLLDSTFTSDADILQAKRYLFKIVLCYGWPNITLSIRLNLQDTQGRRSVRNLGDGVPVCDRGTGGAKRSRARPEARGPWSKNTMVKPWWYHGITMVKRYVPWCTS